MQSALQIARERVEQQLQQHIRQLDLQHQRLAEAMTYGVLNGGKRLRPFLVYATAEALGGNREQADSAAVALEMVHSYSLVHDDLPAMDDDELRRGRPTTHIAFDEATAILAGDALQALAFGWLAEAPGLSESVRLLMVRELARASGHGGMVGGQAIDLESVGKTLALAQLETMHRHKTGALIETSVRIGALTAPSVNEQALASLTQYAKALGLAFQVQDDLLDIEGDTTVIGKPQGSDAARAKPTYPALLGLEGAREHLANLLEQAQQSLQAFGPEADPLRAMADYVVARTH